VRSPRKAKNHQVVGSYLKFHLAHPIFIKPVALKRSSIRDLEKKSSYLEGTHFGDTIKGILSRRTTSKSRFKVILGQHATKKLNLYTR
jgi:hypothetical protein